MINRRKAVQTLALAGLRALISPPGLTAAAGALRSHAASGTLLPYHVVHGWPTLPEDFILGQVSGVGVDSRERVFAFHRADHSLKRPPEPITLPAVLCFDGKTGKLLDGWGKNTFVVPHGLRVDRHDNLWLTDIVLQQVFKYSNDGKLLMSVGTVRTAGCDGTHFNQPTDVAFAEDGTFYVSDGYGNSRVAKFTPDGQFLLDWGRAGKGPGEFNTPHNVLVGPDGRIYVADRGNGRLQIFTPEGKFVSEWKSAELVRPWGLANGPDGFIYMVDGGDFPAGPSNRGRILKLDTHGKILEKWGTSGRYDGQLYLGHDIAVGRSGDVYVGDVNIGMRVQKFSRSRQDCTCLP